MKFNTAFSLATMAIGVIAEPVIMDRGTPVERDVPAITNVLNAVGSGLRALDSAVTSFSGSSSGIDSSAAALISTINSQAATVPSSGALTVADAIALAAPVQALQAVGQTLVSDLIAKKSAFEAAGLCSDISSTSLRIQTASTGLINAIVALVPIAVQPVAVNLAAPFNAALAQGVAAFSAGNCTNVSATTLSTVSKTVSASGTVSSSTVAASSTAVGTSSVPKPTSASNTASSSKAATSAGTSVPSSVNVSGPYPTGTKTSSRVSGIPITPTTSFPATFTGTKTSSRASSIAITPTTSFPATFTGAADMNRIANSFGILALAAAALL